MNNAWRRPLGWTALALGSATLLAYGFWPASIPVDTAPVERGDVIVTVEDEGISQVREIYRVSTPITGTVQRSPVEIGDPVVKGKTVVAAVMPLVQGFLDQRSLEMGEADVKAAEAALTLSKANLDRASAEAQFWRKQLARVERMRIGATISERTVDQTRMEADSKVAAEHSARAEVDLRRRELDRAKAALLNPPSLYTAANGRCCMRVLAPENGVVLKISNESETVVPAGAPLLEIGNPRDLEIVVELLSRDAVKVRPGARAMIESWGGLALNARVRQIDKAGFTKISALGIEEQRVKVWLDLTDPPADWDRLGHDYRVIAKIVIEEAKNVLRVPVSALFRHGASWAVFVRRRDRAYLTNIRIGERNFEWANALDGLKENDAVILYPSDRLTDGVGVMSRQTE